MMYTEAALTALSLAKLKAICKEHGITGYSKLNKAALVQKLMADARIGDPGTSSSSQTTSVTDKSRSVEESNGPPVSETPSSQQRPAIAHPQMIATMAATDTLPISTDPAPVNRQSTSNPLKSRNEPTHPHSLATAQPADGLVIRGRSPDSIGTKRAALGEINTRPSKKRQVENTVEGEVAREDHRNASDFLATRTASIQGGLPPPSSGAAPLSSTSQVVHQEESSRGTKHQAQLNSGETSTRMQLDLMTRTIGTLPTAPALSPSRSLQANAAVTNRNMMSLAVKSANSSSLRDSRIDPENAVGNLVSRVASGTQLANRSAVALPAVANTTNTRPSWTSLSRQMSASGPYSNQAPSAHKSTSLSATNSGFQPASALSPTAVAPNKAKRFVPLLVKRPPPLLKSPFKLAPAAPERTTVNDNARCTFLDFSQFIQENGVVEFQAITPSPPLSQRRRVAVFSVALCWVCNPVDIRSCLLVSKALRYAVYSSAQTRLRRFYSGLRLENMLRMVENTHPNPKILNLWPYLFQRQKEEGACMHFLANTFMGEIFARRLPCVTRLWNAPNGSWELNVAVRFLLTRVWYALSTNQSMVEVQALALQDTIVGVRPANEGVCKIALLRQRETANVLETHLVIEQTGEIVGQDGGATTGQNGVRADWALYFGSVAEASTRSRGLWNHLRWPNHEEYTRGISTLWLRRIVDMGEQGAALRVIAERYVLASVVGNSYTGKYMTSTEMEYEFNGRGAVDGLLFQKSKLKAVSMFLPVQHHVESVHFITGKKQVMHPALAVVYTQAREYYVLRDNGMTVGCEEDGVVPVWRELLKCGRQGEVL